MQSNRSVRWNAPILVYGVGFPVMFIAILIGSAGVAFREALEYCQGELDRMNFGGDK